MLSIIPTPVDERPLRCTASDAVAEVTSLGEPDDDDTPKRPTKPKRPPGKRPELIRHQR